MEDCLFCKIIKGEIPSYTIYEDDIVKVILDISPVTDGHCMIIPKVHTKDIETIDDEVLNHTEKISRVVYDIFKDKLGAEGMTRIQNNGYGQEIKHYHLHLVPRYNGDGVLYNHVNKLTPEEVYKKIK